MVEVLIVENSAVSQDSAHVMCRQIEMVSFNTMWYMVRVFWQDCILQNYFQFNNLQYTQKQGPVMGSPFSSSILSEICLQFLENTKIYNILIVYRDKNTDIHKVLELFNNVSPTLTFTIEEHNNSINILDITIHKNQKKSHLTSTESLLLPTSLFQMILVILQNKNWQLSDILPVD